MNINLIINIAGGIVLGVVALAALKSIKKYLDERYPNWVMWFRDILIFVVLSGLSVLFELAFKTGLLPRGPIIYFNDARIPLWVGIFVLVIFVVLISDGIYLTEKYPKKKNYLGIIFIILVSILMGVAQ